MRPQGLFRVIISGLILVFVLAACQQTPQTDINQPTTDPNVVDPLPTADDTLGDTGDTGDTGASTEILVDLMDNAINMPATVSAGPVSFAVTNTGSMERNFMIEGNGVESMLDAELAPGETATLDVDLEPGTYTISSPAPDDTMESITFELVVA